MHAPLTGKVIKAFLLDIWQQGIWIAFTAVQKIAPVPNTDLQSSSMVRLSSEFFATAAFSKAESSCSSSQAASWKTENGTLNQAYGHVETEKRKILMTSPVLHTW